MMVLWIPFYVIDIGMTPARGGGEGGGEEYSSLPVPEPYPAPRDGVSTIINLRFNSKFKT